MKLRPQFRIITLVALTLLFGLALAFFAPFFRPSPPSVSGLPQYLGKTEQYVIGAIGQPERNEQFNMPSQGTLDEFRIQLHNTYPPNSPTNANVLIRELTWIDGEYFITVWFHKPKGKWIVIDTCKWHRDVRF